jgi:hypothetical protein
MRTGWRSLVVGVILSMILKGKAVGNNCRLVQTDSLRTEVALKVVYNGNLVTPTVDVFINEKKVEAVFDSGSSGLRILGGILKKERSDSTGGSGDPISYGYGRRETFRIKGQVESVNLRLGNLQSGHAIHIMRVDSTKYNPGDVWIPTLDSTRIRSNHFRSLSAIMGVGLRVANNNQGIANPLAQLPGNGKYIIHFPRFGRTKGKLIINPDTTDIKGFVLVKLAKGKLLLPNGDSSWLDNKLSWGVTTDAGMESQNIMLDTGAPDFHNPFGARFFFDFDVLYDQVNGVIGVRKKL